MYSLYKKSEINEKIEFVEQISFFGNNNGWITKLVNSVVQGKNEPTKWEVDIEDCFRNINGRNNQMIVVNLKLQTTEQPSLCELFKVIGFSEKGNTCILLCLKKLLMDEGSQERNAKKIVFTRNSADEPIFSIIYLNGTVIDGNASGLWTPIEGSFSNSILFHVDVLSYFYEKAKKVIDKYEINTKVETIIIQTMLRKKISTRPRWTLNTDLHKLFGLNSLGHLDVIIEIEKEFKISIPGEQAVKLQRKDDIVNYLYSKGNGNQIPQ
jgi:acyl carrier protein